jgi:hypothetical protein
MCRQAGVRQAAGRKNNMMLTLSQYDEKHVVPTPLSVGKGRKKRLNNINYTMVKTYIQNNIFL